VARIAHDPGDDALKLDDPVYLRSVLDEVEQMILPRLVRGDRT